MFAACFLEATILRLQSSAQALCKRPPAPLSLGVCDASSGFSAALFLVGFVPALFLAVVANGCSSAVPTPGCKRRLFPVVELGQDAGQCVGVDT